LGCVGDCPLKHRVTVVEPRWEDVLGGQPVFDKKYRAIRSGCITHRVVNVWWRALHHKSATMKINQGGQQRLRLFRLDDQCRDPMAIRTTNQRPAQYALEPPPVHSIDQPQERLQCRQRPAISGQIMSLDGLEFGMDLNLGIHGLRFQLILGAMFGRSAVVRIPGSAAHTYGTALITR